MAAADEHSPAAYEHSPTAYELLAGNLRALASSLRAAFEPQPSSFRTATQQLSNRNTAAFERLSSCNTAAFEPQHSSFRTATQQLSNRNPAARERLSSRNPAAHERLSSRNPSSSRATLELPPRPPRQQSARKRASLPSRSTPSSILQPPQDCATANVATQMLPRKRLASCSHALRANSASLPSSSGARRRAL